MIPALPARPVETARTPTLFDLLVLERLPCGCVVAAYRAEPWGLGMIAIEAKGPHCFNAAHAQSRVLQMAALSDLVGGEAEE
jgi:hypothetical protein